MNSVWLVSYFVLWLIVIMLTLAVVLLGRQVGLLYRRLGPAPARMENEGPPLGDAPPRAEALTLDGARVVVGGARSKPQLLVFVSANCVTCDALAPAVRSAWKSERHGVDFLLLCMTADEALARHFVKRNKLHEIPCVIAGELSRQYLIFNPPHAVLLDREGAVAAKGVVNNLDHIESLLNAAEAGHPSVESYVRNLKGGEQVVAVE